MWHKLRSRQEAAWPRMEQGEYRSYRAVHPFDEQFGVDTSGLAYELPSGHAHDPYNNGYFAVAPSVFHSIMQALRDRLGLDYRRFSFVDVGSGKGRALLLALDYPFREILGVELSPELDRVARANIARYTGGRYRAPISSIQGDATELKWPPVPSVIYLWNSFTGPVMEQVLRNLKASLAQLPRELYLVYIHPELEPILDGQAWLNRLWREDFAMSEEDHAAWAFPNRDEMCAIYRALPEPAVTEVSETR